MGQLVERRWDLPMKELGSRSGSHREELGQLRWGLPKGPLVGLRWG
jgi:hypothetical protein